MEAHDRKRRPCLKWKKPEKEEEDYLKIKLYVAAGFYTICPPVTKERPFAFEMTTPIILKEIAGQSPALDRETIFASQDVFHWQPDGVRICNFKLFQVAKCLHNLEILFLSVVALKLRINGKPTCNY